MRSDNTNNTLSKIGDLIREARYEKGYTLTDLEKLSGIGSFYIHQLEEGKRYKPSVVLLKKLAQCLDIELEL